VRALEPFEIEIRVVVEALARDLVEALVDGFAFDLAAFEPRMLRQDPGFRRGEHAIESAQHGHGQHDALVLRRTVGTAQQVGNLPDQVREIVVVGHGQG
jgi:hypothetical protein